MEIEERPVDEAFLHEKQLKQPSIPHKHRQVFLKEYEKTKDFEKSAKKALRKELFYYYSGLRFAKRMLKTILGK